MGCLHVFSIRELAFDYLPSLWLASTIYCLNDLNVFEMIRTIFIVWMVWLHMSWCSAILFFKQWHHLVTSSWRQQKWNSCSKFWCGLAGGFNMFDSKECFGEYALWLFLGRFLIVYMFFSIESLPTSPLLCGWYWYCGIVCGGSFFSMTQVVWCRSSNSTCWISNAMKLQTTKLQLHIFQNVSKYYSDGNGCVSILDFLQILLFIDFFGSTSRHQTTRWFAHLNLGMLIKGWGNLYATCPHDVMECSLWVFENCFILSKHNGNLEVCCSWILTLHMIFLVHVKVYL